MDFLIPLHSPATVLWLSHDPYSQFFQRQGARDDVAQETPKEQHTVPMAWESREYRRRLGLDLGDCWTINFAFPTYALVD